MTRSNLSNARKKSTASPGRRPQNEIDRIDLRDARAALKEAKKKGTVPLRKFMRNLEE